MKSDSPISDGDLRHAATNAALRGMAESLATQIGLAALAHPEIIRKALASVFNVKVIEDETHRVMEIAMSVRHMAVEAQALLEAIMKSLDVIERRMEKQCIDVRKAEKELARLGARIKELESSI